MKNSVWVVATLAVTCFATCLNSTSLAAISYVGTDYNIGGTFFPGGQPYWVVPWRWDVVPKDFDIDGNNVYGSDGYALFATKFVWPHVDCCGHPVPVADPTWPNIIDLPNYVSDSRFLVENKVGGWPYALIDDPRISNGYRDYNWGDTQSPPVNPPHSQPAYVMIGEIEGNDILGNDARTGPNGAGRWAFTLGNQVPSRIRVSVMSDGYNDTVWSATELLLAKVDDVGSILDIVGSGAVARNRFVDMHTFDIIGGQAGDNYAIFAKAADPGQGGISGVSFDSIPEPTSMGLMSAAAGILVAFCRRSSNK